MNIKNDKRAVIGMGIAKEFLLGLLTLVIIGVVALIVLISLNTATTNLSNKETISVYNQTYANYSHNVTGGVTLLSSLGIIDPTCSISCINNATGKVAGVGASGMTCIQTGNYTLTGCRLVDSSTTEIGKAGWNVTYSVTFSNAAGNYIIGNATAAIQNFYTNVTIWLSLLGVVIIILIVAVVLVVVNKFGGVEKTEGL